MENETKNIENGCLIAFFAVVIVIVAIWEISTIVGTIRSKNEFKHESELINEGKIVYAREVTETFVQGLVENDDSKIMKYISGDCKYYNNEGKTKTLNDCLKNLKEYSNKYSLEKRGNSIKDEETYRIYWNYEDKKQIIDLFMRRKVKENEIIYEIYTIQFTDNT